MPTQPLQENRPMDNNEYHTKTDGTRTMRTFSDSSKSQHESLNSATKS